ncbi:calmodulin-interacting 111-like isoform X1 [Olea europaea subsp. europaea]|uniref:Calmodulin-interacting 111-like isoform X1 n=2 Tax=Olea europaea subsp. europaea TaxID=158383 RepID=A0A8S0UFM2_OLEEU|nr:calmodulin-interacting 111-like isoform X1 [Olea europaea subsp. europaea]
MIFFDEMDGLVTACGEEGDEVSVGDQVITQLLNELDGVRGRVDFTIIAATNRPDKIDPALLRPDYQMKMIARIYSLFVCAGGLVVLMYTLKNLLILLKDILVLKLKKSAMMIQLTG